MQEALKYSDKQGGIVEQLTKPSSRRYRIDNDWLDEYQNDATRFVDIDQIAKDPTNSQYLTDLNSAPLNRNVNIDQEQGRASFWLNGIMVGDTDVGANVNCVYEEDDLAYNHVSSFLATYKHDVRVRRVYAQNTQGRDIDFLGVGKKTATGPGA